MFPGKRISKDKTDRPAVGGSSLIPDILLFVSCAVARSLLDDAMGLIITVKYVHRGPGLPDHTAHRGPCLLMGHISQQ